MHTSKTYRPEPVDVGWTQGFIYWRLKSRKPYSVSGLEYVVTLCKLRQDGGAAGAAIPSGRSSPSAGLGRPETRGFVPRLQSLNRRWMTKRYRSGWTQR
jgi:hypothetical protein